MFRIFLFIGNHPFEFYGEKSIKSEVEIEKEMEHENNSNTKSVIQFTYSSYKCDPFAS